MTDKEQLAQGVGAHGLWKMRLKSAIATGRLDADVSTIRADNNCAFGKWLYGPTLTAADRSCAHFKSVQTLHAQFHRAAGHVAELAIAGKKDEATKALDDGNAEFSRISTSLTRAMMDWKNNL